MPKASVKKREVKEKRILSGIGRLDKMTEGGFLENSINLLVGETGSGKSILATQFIMEGIKENEIGLYVAFEEKKEEFFKNMLDFGWDLEKLEKEEKFIFLEYTPERVKAMLEEGGGIIESIVLKKKVRRIVIDSITSFALLFEDDLKMREAALSLFGIIRKWGCTALLTYESDPINQKVKATALEFESDSIMVIYNIRLKKERDRFFEILKMRSTKHSREVFPLLITPKGVELGTKAYEGKIE